jgi:hypothetical protein
MQLFEKLFVYTITFIGLAASVALVLSMAMLLINGEPTA